MPSVQMSNATVLNIVLGLILLIVVLSILAFPLYKARLRVSAGMGGASNDLVAQRDGLYSTLRDLDLDYELGKLSREDYQTRRERYVTRASLVLERLDIVRGEQENQGSASDEIERQVTALRQSSEGKATLPDMACPNCGRVYNVGDLYCGRCGHTLK